MKRLIVGLLALTCAGCVPVAKVDVPSDAAKATSLQVSDARPTDEKDKKFFSLLITSKQYGIIRNGDTNISPSPVDVLKDDAFQKWGADHKITVYHFVIYINAKSHLRTMTAFGVIGGVAGALVGNALAPKGSSPQTHVIDANTFNTLSGAQEYQRAFYTHDEDPNDTPAFIVFLDTDIDGKRIFTRTVSPFQHMGDSSALAAAVGLAVKDHLSDYGSGAATTAASPTTTTALVTAASETPPPASAAASTTTAAATAAAQPASAVTTSSAPPQPETTIAAAPKAEAPVSPQTPQTEQAGPTDAAMMSKAQDVANQLGCGAVQSSGDSGYIAPCGDHGVYIGCDGDACRPMHTVSMKAND